MFRTDPLTGRVARGRYQIWNIHNARCLVQFHEPKFHFVSMKRQYFYHLHSTGTSPCTMTKDAYQHARATWLCTGCAAPKPETKSVDVKIQEPYPIESPLTFVSGCGIAIANWEFLKGLNEDILRRDLFLGKVIDPTGIVLRDWVTWRGRRRLIVRGTKNVSHRQCDICGRHVYFAMGRRYLFPRPPTDALIYESDLFGLVTTREVIASITLNRWPKLGLEKLQVLEKPKDSLPELVLK